MRTKYKNKPSEEQDIREGLADYFEARAALQPVIAIAATIPTLPVEHAAPLDVLESEYQDLSEPVEPAPKLSPYQIVWAAFEELIATHYRAEILPNDTADVEGDEVPSLVGNIGKNISTIHFLPYPITTIDENGKVEAFDYSPGLKEALNRLYDDLCHVTGDGVALRTDPQIRSFSLTSDSPLKFLQVLRKLCDIKGYSTGDNVDTEPWMSYKEFSKTLSEPEYYPPQDVRKPGTLFTVPPSMDTQWRRYCSEVLSQHKIAAHGISRISPEIYLESMPARAFPSEDEASRVTAVYVHNRGLSFDFGVLEHQIREGMGLKSAATYNPLLNYH